MEENLSPFGTPKGSLTHFRKTILDSKLARGRIYYGFIIFLLIFSLCASCNFKTDKEEIIDFVYERSKLKLPDDFIVIRNELHGNYQTNDSDFARDVHIKFEGNSKKELIKLLKKENTSGYWSQDGSLFYFGAYSEGLNISFDTLQNDLFIEYYE